MDDPQVDGLIRQLGSRDAREAWATFLEIYSPHLLDVVRLFEREPDAVADCFVFVCEQLCRDRFRRLRRFKTHGPARFSTWLAVVARNLCLDWHRRQVGRERAFESIGRLPALERAVFHCLFVERIPAGELLIRLAHQFPGLTASQAADAITRVERTLTPRQRWLLAVRRSRALASFARAGGAASDEDLLRVPSELPNPETWAGVREARAALLHAMSALEPRERLVIQLRYGRDLTLDEVARATGAGSPQAADRRIREAVQKLREIMAGRAGKPGGPSV